MYLQFSPVRPDELAERVPVAGLRPGKQVHSHRATLSPNA
jgi:hypothetical protein